MSLRLNGSTSGYSEIEAPAVAGDQTFTLPGTGGTIVTADGTQTLTNKTVQGGVITAGTAVASTSGTSIDFTGIPSWVKKITVMFDGVSTDGTSLVRMQLGDSGGIETSDYNGSTSYAGSSGSGGAANSSGFDTFGDNLAVAVRYGSVVFTNLSGNTWTVHGVLTITGTATAFTMQFSGSKTLSDTLTQVRITTVNGTDTFDAGSVNILMEG